MRPMLGDPAFSILLMCQLVLSLLALGAWLHVLRDQSPKALRWAAGATAAWFALVATTIAFMFDVGWVS